MTYRVVLSPQAADSLERLPKRIQKRILRWLDLLAEDPRRLGTRKLEGFRHLRRVHAGKDYVIVYRIKDGELLVLVLQVSHRREAYRRLPKEE